MKAFAGILVAMVISQTAFSGDGQCKVSEQEMEEKQIEQMLNQMTLDEKVALCHGNSKFTVSGVERLGLSEIVLSDGPHGIRRENVRDSWAPAMLPDDYVTYLPPGCALAATWNPELAFEFGCVLGSEARARGKDIILGPGVNIVRTPLCGRNFEYFGEDPYQVGVLAADVVKGIQEQDVAACVKHYALNNQELNRGHVNVLPDERALREIYLPAFKAAVDAGAGTVMGAYNKVRGEWCCENPYLVNDILKEEWGFDGLYLSDWGAVHSTHASAMGGLDLEMGTFGDPKDNFFARPLKEAVETGEIPMEVLDDKVRRMLRVMARIHKLDPGKRKPGAQNTAAHQRTARQIAEEALVLLKNDDVLPLDFNKTIRLAVIGELAVMQHAEGGGSSEVKALYEITPLEGLQRRGGRMLQIEYVQGYTDQGKEAYALMAVPDEVLTSFDPGSGIRSWKAEYFANKDFDGAPLFTRYDKAVCFNWQLAAPAHGLPEDGFSVRWTAELTPAVSGEYRFGLDSDDGSLLRIDGQVVIDNWGDHGPLRKEGQVILEAGNPVQCVVEYYDVIGGASVELGWLPPGSLVEDSSMIFAEALQAAKDADAVIIFAGQSHRYHVEGVDRADIALHGRQNELIKAVAAVNSKLAVFLIGGGAVEMPWIDQVPCVVQAWYAGMEGGSAMADVIFGDVNPSGKLPLTFPKKLSETPAHDIGEYAADECRYHEGLLVGYRYNDAKDIEPLFPFGHGLSYTTFEYGTPEITAVPGSNDAYKVAVPVKNSGDRPGKEVVQLYIRDIHPRLERPLKELKGFVKTAIQPGCVETVEFELTPASFAFYDPEEKQWVTEPGPYEILIGSSSRDIRCQATLDAVSTTSLDHEFHESYEF